MDESPSNKNIWIYVTWASVFIAACVIVLLAWRTMGHLRIDIFETGTNISRLNDQIPLLEKHYSTLANKQKEILEIWGLAALILGIAGGIASILRAPQAVIVVLGGFAAIIFGTTKIYDPQTSLQNLNNARSQLACIKPKVHLLAELSLQNTSNIEKTFTELESAYLPLSTHSSPYILLIDQLKDLNKMKKQERDSALTTIEGTLLIPVIDMSKAWIELDEQVERLNVLKYDLQDPSNDKHFKNKATFLSQLELTTRKLNNTIDQLQRPTLLENKLINQVSSYRESIANLTGQIATGEQISDEVKKLIEELPNKINLLRNWPSAFNAAVTTAFNSVNTIQSHVISQLASGGVTQTSIEEIVAQATNTIQPTSGEIISPSPEPSMVFDDLLAQSELPRTSELSPTSIIQAIDAANKIIAKYKQELSYATSKSQQLKTLIAEKLPLITGFINQISRLTIVFQTRTSTLQKLIDTATKADQKAAEILNLPEPNRLKKEIEACL